MNTLKSATLLLSCAAGVAFFLPAEEVDDLSHLNHQTLDEFGDPEINTRIEQYEMAFRMQTSVPELTDFSDVPQRILDILHPRPDKARLWQKCNST